MSNFGLIDFRDSVHLDAFGRLRVSEPAPLFDNTFDVGVNTFLWETSVTNGSVTHVANNCAARLSTGGTTSGNKAYLQTRQYFRYQPGRSLNVETTFVMGAVQTNSSARIGYFDASNGIFLERTKDATTTTINIVRRTNVTGTPTDNAVAQASWNVDPMTGSGPSGKTLDLTKANILFIQLQFLGVGRVQVGFVIDGIPYVAHQFLNANNLSTVYMSSGCQPVRGEVINNGTSGGTLTMDMFCTSVSSGGLGADKLQYSRSNLNTAISTTTTVKPLISIRAATLLGGTTGGGAVTNRGHIKPVSAVALVSGQIHYYQIILNGTLTNPSWTVNGALSIADYDVSSTAISGGTILETGFIPASASVRATDTVDLLKALPLVYTGLGSAQDILSICAATVTGTGTAYGALTWNEEF